MDSVDASVTMNNLGVLSAHLGNLPQAQQLLSRAHAIRSREYGKGHHLTICARQNLDYVCNQIKSSAASKANGSKSGSAAYDSVPVSAGGDTTSGAVSGTKSDPGATSDAKSDGKSDAGAMSGVQSDDGGSSEDSASIGDDITTGAETAVGKHDKAV